MCASGVNAAGFNMRPAARQPWRLELDAAYTANSLARVSAGVWPHDASMKR